MKDVLKGALAVTVFFLAFGVTYFLVKSGTNKVMEEANTQVTRAEIVTQIKEAALETPGQKELFMEGCLEEASEQYEYCECAYNDIISKVGNDGFAKMSVEMLDADNISDETINIMADTIETCMSKFE